MKKRVTYRPGKANGILSGVVGIILVILSLVMVIPNFGLFGLLWTGIALSITVSNLYHAFGKKYMGPEIRIEEDDSSVASRDTESAATPGTEAGLDVQGRLEQLERLKEAGLLTQEEYQAKRSEIIDRL